MVAEAFVPVRFRGSKYGLQVKVPGSFEVLSSVPRGFRGSKVPKKQVKVPGSFKKVPSLPES